jgi:hypothetical protein
MRTLLHVGAVGLAVLGCGWLMLNSRGQAGEEKEIAAAVDKIARAFEKGDKATASKEAAALAKKIDEMGDVMDFFKPRKKKGFGVGSKAGTISPDGIEQMLISLGRDGRTPAKAEKEASALKQMAYRAAAIMEVALHKAPEKDMGTKTIKLWNTSAKAAQEGALELARAAEQKSGAALKTAASHANTGCNNCHSEFR